MTTYHDQHQSPYWRERERWERSEADRREAELTLLEAIFSDTEVSRVDKAYGFTEPK